MKYIKKYEEAFDLRLDANETSFVSEQLTLVNGEILNPDYKNVRALDFIPPVFRNYLGIRKERFSTLEHWGKAALIADCASLPKADAGVAEYEVKVERLGSCYEICMLEMDAMMRSGQPLDVIKGQAVRRAIDEALDEGLAYGFGATDMVGFFTNASVPVIALPHAGLWSTLTATQILENLEALATTNWYAVGKSPSLSPTTIILDTASYAAARAPFSTTDSRSIISVFLQNTDTQINLVDCWDRADNVGDPIGNGGDPRIVAYRRTPDVVEALLDVVRERPARQDCRKMVHDFEQAVAGVNVRRPQGIAYADVA